MESFFDIINLLINLFVGLSVGINVVAARHFGAKDYDNIQKTVHTSIFLSVISGAFITVLGLALSKWLLIRMNTVEDLMPLASLYLRIYFSGIVFTMIYNFGSALLRAKGDTQRPLYILFSAGLLNLLLNLHLLQKYCIIHPLRYFILILLIPLQDTLP